MARKVKPTSAAQPVLRCLNQDAAGIDVGATEIYVAVPPDRDVQPVRCFATFTEDLHAAASWLKVCRIRTVAMESTGVYWIPLFQILEARGFQVLLVNARHVKNVPGRKSDVADCQWVQYLHSVGLLRASFRPEQLVCSVRSILRHRDSLVKLACVHTQHMQKALHQMNLQLHHVISNINGSTGMAIMEAILAGERNPKLLAKLRDGRIKASEDTIARSLVGDYGHEHLFTLRQSLMAYRHYQELIAACDSEIEQYLEKFASRVDPQLHPLPAPKYKCKPRRNELRFDLRTHLYRIFGVDLTEVPGLNPLTANTLLTEIGPDLSRFANASAFPGSACVPTTASAGARCFSLKPAWSRTGPPRRCASPLNPCTVATLLSASTIDACAPSWELRRPLPPSPTNSPASSTTCSPPDNPMMRASAHNTICKTTSVSRQGSANRPVLSASNSSPNKPPS